MLNNDKRKSAMKNIFRIVGIVISLLLSSILAACHNDNIIYEGPFPLDKNGLPAY